MLLKTRRVFGLCLIALLALPGWPTSGALGARIGLDSTHGFSPERYFGTGPSYSEFRSRMVAGGNITVPVTTFNEASLAGLDALVLKQPYLQDLSGTGYSSSDMQAIHDFVSAGHGLVLAADAGNGSDEMVANFNALAAPYGVAVAALGTEGNGHTITSFNSHLVTAGLTEVGVDFQRILSMNAPAIDLTPLGGADDALAAVNGAGGAGNVVLLSDTSMWTDSGQGSDYDITFGSNGPLLDNVIRFVVPEPASPLALACLAMFCSGRRRAA